jgi:hypothetical protein
VQIFFGDSPPTIVHHTVIGGDTQFGETRRKTSNQQ